MASTTTTTNTPVAPAPPPAPKTLASLADFDAWAFSSPSALHVLYFWAAWDPASAPGGAFDRLLTTLAALHPAALFARVEAEEVPDVSDQFGVAVVPTVVLLRARQVIDRVEGPRAADLTAAVEARMGEAPLARSARGGTEVASLEAVRARITALLAAAPVMLFMKGTPDEPKCKFSRRIVELLREVDASFGSFNILTDPALREALRDFSNWPTCAFGFFTRVVKRAHETDAQPRNAFPSLVRHPQTRSSLCTVNCWVASTSCRR